MILFAAHFSRLSGPAVPVFLIEGAQYGEMEHNAYDSQQIGGSYATVSAYGQADQQIEELKAELLKSAHHGTPALFSWRHLTGGWHTASVTDR